ncbi:MAG: hypothetical protein ACQKBY_09505 [Verrucomicrobiales bacterium]
MNPTTRAFFTGLLWSALTIWATAAEAPKLTSFLKPGTDVKGAVILVEPPKEIQNYLKKVRDASREDPEWFAEYSKTAQSGVPLPFHEKLGLSKEEYEAYLKLWGEREVVEVQAVGIRLEEKGAHWSIRASGAAWPISLLKYDPAKDQFQSTNGVLEKIDDVDAPAESILRAWKGHEWRLTVEGSLSTMKENFAIGASADGKHGFLIYRLQEVSSTGRQLDDKSIVIRYPLTK